MNQPSIDCRRSSRSSIALAGALALLLAACSPSQPSNTAPPAVEVSAVLPVRQTFHAHVAAFGELAADQRRALSLSLPHAVRVLTTEVVAGQRVQRGAPLLKLQTDPVVRSAYLQAEAAVTIAEQDLARNTRLHAQKLVTNAQVDASRQAVANAQATLAAQAELGGAQATSTLRAPAAGVVTALAVQAGQQVPAGTTLVQFSPASALAAQLGVDPAAAVGIRPGMPVRLQPVYAPRNGPPLPATIAIVADAVNPQTHLVDVVATLDAGATLPAGTALSATIATAAFKAWAVPRDALQNDDHGDFIYQIEGGKARRVNVHVVAPAGSPIGVTGTLDPHAPVITLGSYEISAGDAVTAHVQKAGAP